MFGTTHGDRLLFGGSERVELAGWRVLALKTLIIFDACARSRSENEARLLRPTVWGVWVGECLGFPEEEDEAASENDKREEVLEESEAVERAETRYDELDLMARQQHRSCYAHGLKRVVIPDFDAGEERLGEGQRRAVVNQAIEGAGEARAVRGITENKLGASSFIDSHQRRPCSGR